MLIFEKILISKISLDLHTVVHEVSYSLTSLVKYIQGEVETMGLQLNPDFQRGHVWTEAQRTACLEYHLRGGKSGNTIYLNDPFWGSCREPKDGEYSAYVLVDGLQRITAAQNFISNKIKVFGSYFSEYEDKIRIQDATIFLNVNNLKTEKEVLQWYIDDNRKIRQMQDDGCNSSPTLEVEGLLAIIC